MVTAYVYKHAYCCFTNIVVTFVYDIKINISTTRKFNLGFCNMLLYNPSVSCGQTLYVQALSLTESDNAMCRRGSGRTTVIIHGKILVGNN